jgi:uncharacterized membrane protein YphA (DoxX/SURF4 family)
VTIGLLILRLIFGMTMAAHGVQKLFGWFGGGGIAGTALFMEQLGFRPGRLGPCWLGSSRRAAASFSRRASFHRWRPR